MGRQRCCPPLVPALDHEGTDAGVMEWGPMGAGRASIADGGRLHLGGRKGDLQACVNEFACITDSVYDGIGSMVSVV